MRRVPLVFVLSAVALTPAVALATPTVLYEKQVTARADAEWERAPRARGWSDGRRDLIKHYSIDHRYPHDVRAFTYESWMAWRKAQIREEDDHRAYIDLTFGAGRHR